MFHMTVHLCRSVHQIIQAPCTGIRITFIFFRAVLIWNTLYFPLVRRIHITVVVCWHIHLLVFAIQLPLLTSEIFLAFLFTFKNPALNIISFCFNSPFFILPALNIHISRGNSLNDISNRFYTSYFQTAGIF